MTNLRLNISNECSLSSTGQDHFLLSCLHSIETRVSRYRTINSRFQFGECMWFVLTVAQCCATNRKVAGSIPDGVIGIFH